MTPGDDWKAVYGVKTPNGMWVASKLTILDVIVWDYDRVVTSDTDDVYGPSTVSLKIFGFVNVPTGGGEHANSLVRANSIIVRSEDGEAHHFMRYERDITASTLRHVHKIANERPPYDV